MRRKIAFLALVIVGLFCRPAFAANVWDVDLDKSQIDVRYLAEGIEGSGVIDTFRAEIKFSPDDLGGSFVSVHVPMAEIVMDSLEFTKVVKKAAWLNVDEFAQVVFQASRFDKAGEDGQYIAHGILTIKGNSQFVDLPFGLSFLDGSQRVLMSGELVIDRLKYDVGASPDFIGEEIGIRVVLEAVLRAP